MSAREELERRLVEIPGVVRAPSRYGHGFAYRAGPREIAHFHRDGRLDVRLTREVIRLRKSEGGFDQRVTTRGPFSEWVSVRVSTPSDIPLSLGLVEDAVRANT